MVALKNIHATWVMSDFVWTFSRCSSKSNKEFRNFKAWFFDYFHAKIVQIKSKMIFLFSLTRSIDWCINFDILTKNSNPYLKKLKINFPFKKSQFMHQLIDRVELG
jgi:hypothetical protein